MQLFNRLSPQHSQPVVQEDVAIDLPGVRIRFNHRLKIAFLYDLDSQMPDERYVDLEDHLRAQGYFLQVVVAPVGMTIPDGARVPVGSRQ